MRGIFLALTEIKKKRNHPHPDPLPEYRERGKSYTRLPWRVIGA